jgi:hypothetical protein
MNSYPRCALGSQDLGVVGEMSRLINLFGPLLMNIVHSLSCHDKHCHGKAYRGPQRHVHHLGDIGEVRLLFFSC